MKHFKTWGITLLFCVLFGAVISNTVALSRLSKHHTTDCDYKKYSYAYDCVREAEIEYHRWYAEYVMEVQNYITSVAPTSNLRGYALVELCEEYHVDIKFALAQGEIESHFATTGLGARLCNVFNVGCEDGKSAEEVNKEYVKKNPNESIEPYLKLITSKYMVGKLEADLMENYVDINGNRYASDPLYEQKLRSRYEYIARNTRINELSEKVRNYAIKCGRW